MDARARAKRYEKLDFLGEGQVSDRGGGRPRPWGCSSPVGLARVAVLPWREGVPGGPGGAHTGAEEGSAASL